VELVELGVELGVEAGVLDELSLELEDDLDSAGAAGLLDSGEESDEDSEAELGLA
jgi:hypothetical protein